MIVGAKGPFDGFSAPTPKIDPAADPLGLPVSSTDFGGPTVRPATSTSRIRHTDAMPTLRPRAPKAAGDDQTIEQRIP